MKLLLTTTMIKKTFINFIKGKNVDAELAFYIAKEEARIRYSHLPELYTGTILDKQSFVFLQIPSNKSPHQFIQETLNDPENRISSVNGPAGIIQTDINSFTIFGWAILWTNKT